MKKISLMLIVSVMLLSTLSIMSFSHSDAQAFPKVKQLTKNDLPDCYGSGGYPHDHVLSWDGSKVVFCTEHSKYDYKVYVMNTTDDPGQERLMTTAPGMSGMASISADGSKIVFVSNRDDPTDPWYSCEIFVMNTTDNPGDEIQITDDNLLDHDPDISGNGEIIAWHSAPTSWTGFDIIVANISDMNNVNITRLPTGPKNDLYPSLTYDGESLSFWGGIGPEYAHSEGDVFLINSDGTGLRNLTNSPDFDFNIALSGDGSRVAFQRIVGGDYEIFVYDIIHDTFTQLTDNGANDILGGINGDGTVVTYSRDGNIFIHNMTVETQLTDGTSDDKYPRISGDGNVMVFLSNRDGPDYDIFITRLREQISASVDVKPDTFNLKSRGKSITCYIELSEDYNVSDIDVSTILLKDTIPAELHPTKVGDYDNDTIPDLMVKFDRADVIEYILNTTAPDPDKFMNITLTVTGKLYDETPFEGSDTIRVITPALIGRGWGLMQITPEECICGRARLFKMEDRLIQLAILDEDEEYSRNWEILRHEVREHSETYLCYNEEWGFLIVKLHESRRCRFWCAVGRGVAAFGPPRFGKLKLMPPPV